MIFEGYTALGEKVNLGNPVSVKISRDEDAPADGFSGTFPGSGFPELSHVKAYDGNTLYFYGIIDEQSEVYETGGISLKLAARSMAAPLLDNEAEPQTYTGPSLQAIYLRHAAPYGLKGCLGKQGSQGGKLTVSKGMSDWQVVEQFCTSFLGVVPKVTAAGVLDASGMRSGKSALFGTGGYPLLSASVRRKPYALLSDLYVQTEKGGAYSAHLQSRKADASGIRRKRYVFFASTRDAELLLRQAERDAWEIELEAAGWPDLEIGGGASVRDSRLGKWEGLIVSSLHLFLDSSGKRCRLVLKGA